MKKNILTTIFSLAVLTGFAQLERFSLSSNQQFIEDAVKNGLFIIRQEYKLRDVEAKTSYGLDGKSYFGETYSLGIKVNEGYYINDKVINPWNYDSNFDKYRNNPKYTPIISTCEYKSLEDSLYCSLSLDRDSFKDAPGNSFVRIENDKPFEGKGFSANTTFGKKEGWLVWAVTSMPVAKNPNSPVSLISYRKELVFEAEKENYEIENPPFDKEITGGIYIVPEITEIGQVTFRLAGLLHLKNNKWNVMKIENSTIEKSNSKNELTPVNKEVPKNKKRRK